MERTHEFRLFSLQRRKKPVVRGRTPTKPSAKKKPQLVAREVAILAVQLATRNFGRREPRLSPGTPRGMIGRATDSTDGALGSAVTDTEKCGNVMGSDLPPAQ